MEISRDELVRRISGDITQWNAWRKMRKDVRFDLSGVAFGMKASRPGIDLSNMDLSDASLCWGHFSGADFHDSNLTRADLRGAELTCCNFENAIMRNICASGVDLGLSRCMYVDFTEAYIERARLTFADFMGATFVGVKWQEVVIWGVHRLSEQAKEVYLADLHDNFRSCSLEEVVGVH